MSEFKPTSGDRNVKFLRNEQSPDISFANERNARGKFLVAALCYANRGWGVFPAVPRDKPPRIKEWQHRATTDPEQIKNWWTKWPNANIAIATGNGLGVLDVDFDKGGDLTLRKLREQGEFPMFPDVPTALTGNGLHFYFEIDGEKRNKTGLFPGIDWRGDGGYVIAPPSVHPNGLSYQWWVEP